MLLIQALFHVIPKTRWRRQPLAPQSAVFQSASLTAALIALDTDRFVQSSSRFCDLVGYSPTELLEQTASDLNFWRASDRPNLLKMLRQGAVQRYECQLRHQSGCLVNVELSIEQIQLNCRPYALIIGIGTDQSKQTEALLQTSLQEKEVLLKEVHHRVRNNLHLVSNLLDLQAGTLNDQRLADLFTTTQNRIQSLTLIYEQLYESDNLARVDFGEYLKRLTLNVFLANSSTLGLIQPKIEVESLFLNLETAVPCALLVNELLLNCLKHAFLEGEAGEVHVKLYQTDRHIHVEVSDNGIGLAPDLDWQNSTSLGFKLIRILAKQLKATVDLNRQNFNSQDSKNQSGTSVRVTFSELQYKSRF
jgi:PAS domain S-box-containing protein